MTRPTLPADLSLLKEPLSASEELDDLFNKSGTDKGSAGYLERVPKRYHEIYGQLLEGRQGELSSLLEIGYGGSLAAWRAFFPYARISCIEIRPVRVAEGVDLYQGDQTDGVFLEKVIQVAGPFDVVIDDGSHRPDDSAAAFVTLWPAVKTGGLYVIEDLHADPENYRQLIDEIWTDYAVSVQDYQVVEAGGTLAYFVKR